jgi:ABC-2 type transport system ATP-binding protein
MDPLARRATWDLIAGLKAQGVTALLTTHYMDEAERLADRVAIMHHGRLVAAGPPAALAGEGAFGVTFCAPAGLDTASLAAALAGAEREPEPGRYLVDAEATPARLAHLAAWLAERDALMTELHTGRRSLEDTYLRLTGGEGAAPWSPGALAPDYSREER